MMPFASQIPAIHKQTGKHLLALGLIDSLTVLCVTEEGDLEPFDYPDLRMQWFYDDVVGIWDTSQPTVEDLIDAAAQARESEDVSEGLPETDGAGDGDPAGGRGRGKVDSDEE